MMRGSRVPAAFVGAGRRAQIQKLNRTARPTPRGATLATPAEPNAIAHHVIPAVPPRWSTALTAAAAVAMAGFFHTRQTQTAQADFEALLGDQPFLPSTDYVVHGAQEHSRIKVELEKCTTFTRQFIAGQEQRARQYEVKKVEHVVGIESVKAGNSKIPIFGDFINVGVSGAQAYDELLIDSKYSKVDNKNKSDFFAHVRQQFDEGLSSGSKKLTLSEAEKIKQQILSDLASHDPMFAEFTSLMIDVHLSKNTSFDEKSQTFTFSSAPKSKSSTKKYVTSAQLKEQVKQSEASFTELKHWLEAKLKGETLPKLSADAQKLVKKNLKLQQAVETAVKADQLHQNQLQTASESADMVLAFAQLTGDRNLVDLGMVIKTGVAVMAATSGIGAVTAVLGLMSYFNQRGGVSPERHIIEKLSTIERQINDLHIKFNKLDRQLDNIRRQVQMNLHITIDAIRQSEFSIIGAVNTRFERLENLTKELAELEERRDIQYLLKPFNDAHKNYTQYGGKEYFKQRTVDNVVDTVNEVFFSQHAFLAENKTLTGEYYVVFGKPIGDGVRTLYSQRHAPGLFGFMRQYLLDRARLTKNQNLIRALDRDRPNDPPRTKALDPVVWVRAMEMFYFYCRRLSKDVLADEKVQNEINEKITCFRKTQREFRELLKVLRSHQALSIFYDDYLKRNLWSLPHVFNDVQTDLNKSFSKQIGAPAASLDDDVETIISKMTDDVYLDFPDSDKSGGAIREKKNSPGYNRGLKLAKLAALLEVGKITTDTEIKWDLRPQTDKYHRLTEVCIEYEIGDGKRAKYAMYNVATTIENGQITYLGSPIDHQPNLHKRGWLHNQIIDWNELAGKIEIALQQRRYEVFAKFLQVTKSQDNPAKQSYLDKLDASISALQIAFDTTGIVVDLSKEDIISRESIETWCAPPAIDPKSRKPVEKFTPGCLQFFSKYGLDMDARPVEHSQRHNQVKRVTRDLPYARIKGIVPFDQSVDRLIDGAEFLLDALEYQMSQIPRAQPHARATTASSIRPR
jgi:hypothetical protein